MSEERTEIRDGMRITFDMPIPMDDGIVLRCDVFRPVAEGRYPVIMNHGAYGKGLAFQEKHAYAWERMAKEHPDTVAGSSNKYQNWEVVDPEKWVPEGYAVVRVDCRGAGRSPGVLNPWSPREIRDYYDCIEHIARQPWCSGKVGLNGISYYARTQWYVAALQPPHLAAICVWEGAQDCYRDITHHGGMVSDFMLSVFPRQILNVQHGVGERGSRCPWDGGGLVAGPETRGEDELERNRVDMAQWIVDHPLDDHVHRERTPDLSKVTVPLLSCGNWGGHGLHLRGNLDGYARAASQEKWLEVHGDTHWAHFYTDYGVRMQKRFFAHFLKGEGSWANEPPVRLQIRHLDRFVERHEREWPLARTRWTKFWLDPSAHLLSREAPRAAATLAFEAMGNGLLFVTEPFAAETEITGPLAARLFVSSSTSDADLFVMLRLYAPDGNEVVFQGASDPHAALAYGWLRASHRKLDPALSRPEKPHHAHDAIEPLTPGTPVALDIELWPTCIVVPRGYRLGLSVQGRDCEPDDPPIRIGGIDFTPHATVGPFRHNHPQDRPPAIFGGRTTLHFEPGAEPYLLLPVIP